MYFVFSTFCIFEREVHLRGFVGEPVSDVRPYLAPVDELIEANYKRREGRRRTRGGGGPGGRGQGWGQGQGQRRGRGHGGGLWMN